MPDLKYRVLYILINCFFKQIVDICFNKAYYQESYIPSIEYISVVTRNLIDKYAYHDFKPKTVKG